MASFSTADGRLPEGPIYPNNGEVPRLSGDKIDDKNTAMHFGGDIREAATLIECCHRLEQDALRSLVRCLGATTSKLDRIVEESIDAHEAIRATCLKLLQKVDALPEDASQGQIDALAAEVANANKKIETVRRDRLAPCQTLIHNSSDHGGVKLSEVAVTVLSEVRNRPVINLRHVKAKIERLEELKSRIEVGLIDREEAQARAPRLESAEMLALRVQSVASAGFGTPFGLVRFVGHAIFPDLLGLANDLLSWFDMKLVVNCESEASTSESKGKL